MRAPSLVEMLRRRAAERPGARAFTLLPDGETEGPVLDYDTLDRKARAIAATLQAMDADGQRALLLYPFGLDYLAAFFGSLYGRVVAVPVYPPDPGRLERTLPRLRAVAADSMATLVLTTGAIRSMVDGLVGLAPEFARLRFVATDAIGEESASAWREHDVAPSTLALLQYTSGSTSSPKGVMVTHRNLLHNEELCHQSTRLGPESVWVSWLPMYHDMGLIGGLLHPIYVGAACYLLPPQTFLQRPLRWLRAISRYRATISGGPNFAYDLCVRKVTSEERDQLDLSAWSYAFNGAEPVRKDTLDRFARYFAPAGFAPEAFRPLYGLAEATLEVTGGVRGTRAPVLSVDASALLANRVVRVPPGQAGSRELVGCGGTFLDQSIAIVDPDTCAPRPPGEVGEIWVKGSSVASGYWNRPEETEQTFRASLSSSSDGRYLRTGDLGFIADGDLFVTGRRKDLIVVRGKNHYPQDIERTVEESHGALRPGCGAAFAMPAGAGGGPQGEQVVVVYEVGRGAGAAEYGAVAAAARRRVAEEHGLALAALALVRHGTIPKTSSGKIQRAACRSSFLDGSLDLLYEDRGTPAPPRPPALATSAAGAVLFEESRRGCGLGAGQIDRSRTLAELGLDSMALLEVRAALEQHAARPLDEGDLHRPIDALLALLEDRAQVPATSSIAAEGPQRVVWDLASRSPELHRHLLAAEPWLASLLDRLRREVPSPPTNSSFDDPEMFRPPGHFRAFYLRGPGEAVVALKGADLRCEDQRGFLAMLKQRSFERFAKFSVMSALEYFLLQEHKVPGALLLPEALAEAGRAAEVQGRLLERTGALGALPVPLLVLRWSDEVVARFKTTLLPLLSGHPRGIAEHEINGGLACYVYYFPRPPAPRVSHFAGALAQESARTGAGGIPNTRLVYTTLKHNLDPGAVVDSWLELVARMLLVGYFPCDALHFKNGQCIEPQNVLLNGALADLDSVTPMQSLATDREFYANFLVTLNLLANTMRVFLLAENNGTTAAPSPFPAQFPKPDFLDILTTIHIWERLKVHLARLSSEHPGELDPRLRDLVASNLAFPVLFEKVLFALHYAGPELPESVLHMLNITDVYGDPGGGARRPITRLSYDATLHVDAAALVTIPRSFLQQLQLPVSRFVKDVLRDDAALLTVYETFLGRIGLVVLPIDDASIYDRPRTLDAARKGLDCARRLGASTVTLTGLVPSATDYGRALAPLAEGVQLTTGHATTVACFVMMVARLLREAGRDLAGEDTALLGLGSIGSGILSLLLACLPHPRRLRLCEVPARREHIERLRREVLAGGYRGEVELITIPGGAVPDPVYNASLILSATSTPNILDVERLLPGTLVIDDSAPHCFAPRAAIRRFQRRRDILFTEAGALRSHRPIREISDLNFSTGWDHKVRAALRLLHPQEDTIMGCVFSSILTHRFDDAPATIGTPTPEQLALHHRKLAELRFEGARPYCEDHQLDEELIALFRAQHGATAGAGGTGGAPGRGERGD